MTLKKIKHNNFKKVGKKMERERQNENWKTEAQEEESKVSFHILDRVSIFSITFYPNFILC